MSTTIQALTPPVCRALKWAAPFLIDQAVYQIFGRYRPNHSRALWLVAVIPGSIAWFKIVPESDRKLTGFFYLAYKVGHYFYTAPSKQDSQIEPDAESNLAQSPIILPILTVHSRIILLLVEIEVEITREGIYRESGSSISNSSKLKTLKANPNADLSFLSVLHTAAFVKTLLRALEPRLLESLRDFFLLGNYKTVSNLEDHLAHNLPPDRLALLKILILHLRRVAQNAGSNQMNSTNLATSIGPSFFADNFSTDPAALSQERAEFVKLNEGIAYLIDHSELFNEHTL